MNRSRFVPFGAPGAEERHDRAVRLAVVGCGRLAEVGYVPALAAAADARLVAAVDPDPARRAAIERLVDGPVGHASSVSELLADHGDVDGVIIASPAAFHLEAATVATDAGLPVLVEKPPAPDVAGARAIAALSPTPWVGFNRRFDRGALAARVAARLADGPLDLTIDLLYRTRSWSAVSVNDDVLHDLGPHVFDWVRWITGDDIASVSASADHHRASIHAELTGGGTASIRLASDRRWCERLVVVDGGGHIVADHRLGGPIAGVTGRVRRGPHPLVATLTAQVDAFAHAIAGRVSPLLGTAADGVAVMAVIEAATASAAGGASVAVDHSDLSPA